MLTKPYPPISSDGFEKMCKEWVDVILAEESGTWIWPPLNAPYRRIWQFQKDIPLQKKLMGGAFASNIMVHVDLEQIENIDHVLIQEIIRESLISQAGAGSVANTNVHQMIDDIIINGKKSLNLFITGIDASIRNNNWFALDELNSLAHRNWETHILLFAETNLASTQYFPFFSKRTTLAQNIEVTPLYSEADTESFISYISFNWKISPDRRQLQWIRENCGGHFLLVKEALRLIRKDGNITPEKISDSESMILKAQAILSNYSDSEMKTIAKVAAGLPPDKGLFPARDFLLKQSLISGKGGLTVKYLEKIVAEKGLEHGKSPSNLLIFTQAELKLFELMKSRLGSLIDRTQIAEGIWEENWEDRYSDWAIDQKMFRLRTKLKKGKFSFELITKKGMGFVLQEK